MHSTTRAMVLWTCVTVAAAGCASSGGGNGAPAPDGPIATRVPPERIAWPRVILVADFSAATRTAGSEQQAHLLPGFLRSAREDLTNSQLVTRLSGAVVDDLRQRGYNAARYGGGALPDSGWLVQGTFIAEQGSSDGVLARRFAREPVELVVLVNDLVRGVPEPLVHVALEGDRSGEGVPMVPNPYAAAAKFVVRQAELSSDDAALAARVADSVVRLAQSEHVDRGAAR